MKIQKGIDAIPFQVIPQYSYLCALCVLISAYSAVKALNPNRKDRKGKTRSSQSFGDAG